jgi:uncharacterized membrane protein
MSALAVALITPLVILGVWAFLQVVPRIDPRGVEVYDRFRPTYNLIANAIFLFMTASHVAVVFGALGIFERPDGFLIAGAGVLIAIVGNNAGRVEPNWFFGLRTPWTLSSDVVWRKTHRAAGQLAVLVGSGLAAFGIWLPLHPGVALGGSAAVIGGLSMVLSYVFWLKEGSPSRAESP